MRERERVREREREGELGAKRQGGRVQELLCRVGR